MSKCDLDVRLEKDDRTYRSGEMVRGRVRVTPHGDVECRGLKLTAGWRTHGRGNRAQSPSPFVRTLFQGRWSAGAPQEYPFEFPAPAGPATYHGKLLNVDHYVTALADVPWAGDPKDEVEILIPGGGDGAYDFGPEHGSATARTAAQLQLVGPAAVPAVAGLFVAIAAFGVFMFTDEWLVLALLPLAALGIAYGFLRRKVAEKQLGVPLVTLRPDPARPGDAVSVQVAFEPRADVSLKGGRVSLVATERVVSGSGTNRTTHTHELHKSERDLSLGARRVSARHPVSFQETLALPETAPPTFMADDNHLTWTVRLCIAIDGWPDWEKELTLAVRPR